MKYIFLGLVFLITLLACTKKVATNPALAFSDKALLDSCRNKSHAYYKNDSASLLSGSAGPHGTFKLRFNKIAQAALTDNGKLPINSKLPEGALVIKDVYNGNDLSYYALMYKKSGSWLWGEIKPGGEVLYSVNKNPSICIGCHSQPGQRDLVVSFNFH